ncbi:hypothetical protein GGR54DRAFT_131559 [Hypoxylon sp. NC1633]|nr:hypothetical protein GGR54DRAFT_131559 [Hypoxylon sp. NC1633]
MTSCIGGFRAFTARLVGVKPKRASSEKPPLQISAPFNFKHETASLPGISEDEVAILKRQVTARRLEMANMCENPRPAPAPPIVKITPSSPIPPLEGSLARRLGYVDSPEISWEDPRPAPAVPVLNVMPGTPTSPVEKLS